MYARVDGNIAPAIASWTSISYRPEEITIEQFMPSLRTTIAKFGIEYLRQFVGYRFILGIHQLGDENLRKEPREVIKLEREDS